MTDIATDITIVISIYLGGVLFIFLLILFTVNRNRKIKAKVKELHRQERNCGEFECGTCRNIPYGQNEPKKKRKR